MRSEGLRSWVGIEEAIHLSTFETPRAVERPRTGQGDVILTNAILAHGEVEIADVDGDQGVVQLLQRGAAFPAAMKLDRMQTISGTRSKNPPSRS